jgi:hypothetical protein
MGVRKSNRFTLGKFLHNDPLRGANLPDLPKYGTGEVAEILGIKMWRLQKFLDSPRFQLSASGQVGKGQGSRRLFTKEDMYRLGTAFFLTKDGFGPKLVSEVLQRVEDRDLNDVDEDSRPVRWHIVLIHGRNEPKIELRRSGDPGTNDEEGDIYYTLDLGDITEEIDRRIVSLENSRRR